MRNNILCIFTSWLDRNPNTTAAVGNKHYNYKNQGKDEIVYSFHYIYNISMSLLSEFDFRIVWERETESYTEKKNS